MSAIVVMTSAVLETLKIHIRHQANVAAVAAINKNNIPTIKVFPFVQELHCGFSFTAIRSLRQLRLIRPLVLTSVNYLYIPAAPIDCRCSSRRHVCASTCHARHSQLQRRHVSRSPVCRRCCYLPQLTQSLVVLSISTHCHPGA